MILPWTSRRFAAFRIGFAGLAWVVTSYVPVGWQTRQTLINEVVISYYAGGLIDDTSSFVFTGDNSEFYLTWG